jgi:hypothetical protein
MMRIEILYIADCPNWRDAGTRLHTALARLGVAEVSIDYRLLSEREDFRGAPFAGSPTMLVDGRDLFPSQGATGDLACRVYVSEGRLAPLPTVDDLTTALRARVEEPIDD